MTIGSSRPAAHAARKTLGASARFAHTRQPTAQLPPGSGDAAPESLLSLRSYPKFITYRGRCQDMFAQTRTTHLDLSHVDGSRLAVFGKGRQWRPLPCSHRSEERRVG